MSLYRKKKKKKTPFKNVGLCVRARVCVFCSSSRLPTAVDLRQVFSGDKQPSSHWILFCFFFCLVQGRPARVVIKVLSMLGGRGVMMSSEGERGGSLPGSLRQQENGSSSVGGGGGGGDGRSREEGGHFFFFISPLWSCLSESEVPGAGVAVVVELLLDVDHVAAGVLQLSELGTATQVPQVAELGEPRPRRGVVVPARPPGPDGAV